MSMLVFSLVFAFGSFRLKLRFSYSIVWALTVTSSLIYLMLLLKQNLDSPFALVLLVILGAFISHKFSSPKKQVRVQRLSIFIEHTLLFFVAIVLLLKIPSNFKFLAWDELSAWTNRSKFIFETRYLWKQGDLEFFPFYPPILNVLHQIFLAFEPTFNEALVLRTQVFFIFAILICFLGILANRHFYVRLLTLLSAFSIPYFFGFTFYTAYPDLLLGLLFALSVYILLYEENLEDRLLMLMPLMFFLVLLKPTGIFFAFSAQFFFLIYFGARKDTFREVMFYAASAIAAFVSWQFYTFSNHLNTTKFTPLNLLLGLWQDLFGSSAKPVHGLNELSHQTSSGFAIAHKMFSDYFDGDIKFLIPILIFGFLYSILYSLKIKYIVFALVMFVAYEVLLLFTYIYLMSGYEAENTASHSRYLATLLMPLVIVCLVEAAKRSTDYSLSLIAFTIFIGSLSLTNNPKIEITSGQPFKDGLPARDNMYRLFNSVSVPENSKLMFLEQNAPSVGYTRLLFSYEAIPFRTSLGCWSWGDPYYSGDIWTCAASGLIPYLELYDFIFVESADEKFFNILDENGIAYNRKIQKGVYAIDKQNTSRISLRAIVIDSDPK